jgi:hypothetical protein
MNGAPVLVFGKHAQCYRPNAGASVARALPEKRVFMFRRLCYQPSQDVKRRGGPACGPRPRRSLGGWRQFDRARRL